MPDLGFEIEGASMVPFAAVPTLAFKLRIKNAAADESIHNIALHSQIQIEVTRRRYAQEEQQRLLDLFGEPDRWSQTLRSMLWTHANVTVPGFSGTSAAADLHVPCSFDFNVAATKYFAGLAGGRNPPQFPVQRNCLLCGGRERAASSTHLLDKEARFKLPVKVWREMMDAYYPNNVWLNLRRDVFERLYRYKMRNAIPTWEQALETMLPVETVEVEAGKL